MANAPIVVTGATGHIGGEIARILVAKGKAVRVVGRSREKLQALHGAEPAVGSVEDTAFLAKAFAGAEAVFVMIPPNFVAPDVAADQDRITAAYASALATAKVKHAVVLSSIGGNQARGLGPICGLHRLEERLAGVAGLNALSLRPAFFMENHLNGIGTIKAMGVSGTPAPADVPLAQIATRDIAAVAARRLLALDFAGHSVLELLGPRDYTMTEATRVLGAAIGKPDLRYVQFPYADARAAMIGMGMSASVADSYIEMYQGFAAGLAVPTQRRSPTTTTPTTMEEFATTVFAPAFKAAKTGEGK